MGKFHFAVLLAFFLAPSGSENSQVFWVCTRIPQSALAIFLCDVHARCSRIWIPLACTEDHLHWLPFPCSCQLPSPHYAVPMSVPISNPLITQPLKDLVVCQGSKVDTNLYTKVMEELAPLLVPFPYPTLLHLPADYLSWQPTLPLATPLLPCYLTSSAPTLPLL